MFRVTSENVLLHLFYDCDRCLKAAAGAQGGKTNRLPQVLYLTSWSCNLEQKKKSWYCSQEDRKNLSPPKKRDKKHNLNLRLEKTRQPENPTIEILNPETLKSYDEQLRALNAGGRRSQETKRNNEWCTKKKKKKTRSPEARKAGAKRTRNLDIVVTTPSKLQKP